MSTWHRFLVPLGGQHGSQNPPKMRSKRLQNRWKIDVEVDVVFACFQDRFFWFLGPTWPQMSFQMGPQGVGFWSPFGVFFGLLGLLGPKLGLLGPKTLQDRIFINFWSILGAFWTGFGPQDPHFGVEVRYRFLFLAFLYRNFVHIAIQDCILNNMWSSPVVCASLNILPHCIVVRSEKDRLCKTISPQNSKFKPGGGMFGEALRYIYIHIHVYIYIYIYKLRVSKKNQLHPEKKQLDRKKIS